MRLIIVNRLLNFQISVFSNRVTKNLGCIKRKKKNVYFQSVPSADKKRPGSPLSVLEVEDPKQCILAHFMTPLEPLEPAVESPVSRPLVLQRDTAAELLSELAPTASQSILLANMERNGKYLIITVFAFLCLPR